MAPTATSPGASRRRRLAVMTALLAVASLALFVVLDAAQATGRGVAERALGRAVASLTEVDSLAPAVIPELQASRAAEAGESLTVPDFAVRVALTPEEVAGFGLEELRDTLVERSAEAVYEGGMSVFRADADDGGPGLLSVPGAVDSGLDLLREKNHGPLQTATWVLAAISAALAALIAATASGYARLTLVGSAVLAAAAASLVAAAGARLLLWLAGRGTGDYISSELLRLAQDMSWLPIRNGIAFAGLGLALLLLGFLGSRLQERLARSED